MKFLPTSDADRSEMLRAIGVSSVEDLFASIPGEVRQPPNLPPPLSEIEVRRLLGSLAARNANARESAFFLGAGIYNHYVSAIADQMLYRAEWLTSYTPYQPEVSQGTLQSIFEFQTHICLLTGLDVANASLYEGASALVEALLMASRAIQSPNFYGIVEDWQIGSRAAHGKGALSVAVVAEAVSMALLAPPGDRGADIACGEAQSLGVPMHLGGPVLGFLACRSEHERQIPGRLVGETRDADGRRAFCLTLSTREQHIRRERATSNICTNQGLMALASNIHCSLLGKKGLREVALQSHAKAEYLKGEIARIPGWRIPFSAPTFNEFVVEAPGPAAPLLSRLAGRGILAGVPLSRWEPESPNRFLVATTEMNAREEMERLVATLRSAS